MLEKKTYDDKIALIPEVSDVLEATDLGTNHTVDDWPWGRKRRCSMHFFVESNKRGERFVKQSTMDGRTYKPKTATYATKVKLIEIDGKMGHVEWNRSFQMFSVYIEDGQYWSGDFHGEEAQKLFKHYFQE